MTMDSNTIKHVDVWCREDGDVCERLLVSKLMPSNKVIDYIMKFNYALVAKGFTCCTINDPDSRSMEYHKGNQVMNLVISNK